MVGNGPLSMSTLIAMEVGDMSVFSKIMSSIRGDGKPKPPPASGEAVESAYAIPTVRFDPNRVTDAVKDDLKNNIKGIKDFDDANFEQVYDAALRSITRGRDLAILFNAIMELNIPDMSKLRAGEISRILNNKATALIDRDQKLSLGIKYAVWVYSGAPCQNNPKKPSAKDIRQNEAHKAADGKRYEISQGMLINGRLTMPGRDEGCKCFSRAVIPGLS